MMKPGAMAAPSAVRNTLALLLLSTPAAVPSSLACPCISSYSGYNVTDVNANAGGATFTAFSPGSAFGEQYGLGCSAHDMGLAPFCDNAVLVAPSWCTANWCWVNASNCDASYAPTASAFFEDSTGLTYSYDTCNSTNSFIEFYTTGVINLCSVFSLDSSAFSFSNIQENSPA